MARKLFPLSVLMLGATVAGCASQDPAIVAKHNPTLYSVHQPVVQRSDYVLDLAAGGSGLASGEAARLHGWFDSIGLRYGDRISVDGRGYDADARADVARVAEAYGLLLSDGAPITAGAVSPGAVRVVVSRASASVPGCPDWAYSQLSGAPVSTDANYGCAFNSNLAAMIADPTDLVLGQEGSGTDASTVSKPVRAYRSRTGSGASGNVQPMSPGGN